MADTANRSSVNAATAELKAGALDALQGTATGVERATGLYSQRGRSAFDAASGVYERLKKKRQEISARLNAAQRAMFDEDANGVLAAAHADIEGYVHISENPSETRLEHPSQALTVGQKVTAVVMKNDRKKNRIALSIGKYERGEEKRLLKQYKATSDGVTLAEVTGFATPPRR